MATHVLFCHTHCYFYVENGSRQHDVATDTTQEENSPRATVEATSLASNGTVKITLTGSDPPGVLLDFVDIVGVEGIQEDLTVIVPGVLEGAPLPK